MSDLYAFRHQPLKALYLTYQLLSTVCIRIPLWALFALPRSWRPRKSWTVGRVLRVKLIRHFMYISSRTGPFIKMPDHLSIVAGLNINGIWVEPCPELVGAEIEALADVADVSPVRIPGYWMHKKGSSLKVGALPQPGEKIIYALHGGGYIRFSGNPNDPTAAIVRGFLKHVVLVQRIFSLEYRLSRGKPFDPAFPFPAALLDALAGYNYLVNVAGFSPNDIIIEGDSAGANLGLALTRYLVENNNNSQLRLPSPPGGLILLSPWCDLSQSHENLPNASASLCASSDYLGEPKKGGHDYPKLSFLGPHGLEIARHNRYISPASLDPELRIDFKGFPRTFIVGGGAEILLDQIRTLKERMIKDIGEGDGAKEGDGKVRYFEAPDAVHDYLVFPWHEPERSMTLKEINRWVSIA